MISDNPQISPKVRLNDGIPPPAPGTAELSADLREGQTGVEFGEQISDRTANAPAAFMAVDQDTIVLLSNLGKSEHGGDDTQNPDPNELISGGL